jgi:hypothetical protein
LVGTGFSVVTAASVWDWIAGTVTVGMGDPFSTFGGGDWQAAARNEKRVTITIALK